MTCSLVSLWSGSFDWDIILLCAFGKYTNILSWACNNSMFHCNDERPQLIRIACLILVECTCTYMYFAVTLTTIVRDTRPTASADDITVI